MDRVGTEAATFSLYFQEKPLTRRMGRLAVASQLCSFAAAQAAVEETLVLGGLSGLECTKAEDAWETETGRRATTELLSRGTLLISVLCFMCFPLYMIICVMFVVPLPS